MNLKPLNERISKIVNDFLDAPEYYDRLKTIAENLGTISNDPIEIKMAMFTHDGTNLGFVSNEVEELFFEWQLFESISDQEPYTELLKSYPKRRSLVINLAKKMWAGEDVTDKEIITLFDIDKDER